MNRNKISLEQLFALWIKEKYRYAPKNTVDPVRRIAEKHILPLYGNVPVSQMTDAFAQLCVRQYLKKAMWETDRRAALAILRDLSEYACRKKLLAYNAFFEITVPEKTGVRHHAVSESDIRFIMQLAPDCPEHIFFQVKLLTGTRTAECLALCWEHVDFELGTIKVCDQLQYVTDDQGNRSLKLVGHTKNFKARVIKPPQITFELLQIRRQQQNRYRKKPEWNQELSNGCLVDKGLIFDHEDGTPVSPVEISLAFRNRVSDVLGTKLRLHDLRITNATVQYRLTKDLKTVQKNLGHKSAAVTMKYYIDPDPSQNRDVAIAMNAYYENILNGNSLCLTD